MQLSEKIILRRYNALANDWTPLSRKPCWLSNAFHCKYNYMKRNRFAWFRLPLLSTQIPTADNKLHCACDKSFADDLVPSRYCKRESHLCMAIRWGFCGVSSICSSLIFQSDVVVGCALHSRIPYQIFWEFPSSYPRVEFPRFSSCFCRLWMWFMESHFHLSDSTLFTRISRNSRNSDINSQ